MPTANTVKRTGSSGIVRAAAVVCCASAMMFFSLGAEPASAAHFDYVLDANSYQQVWNQAKNWALVSGVDDGDNGYPDGTDTFTIDRSTVPGAQAKATRLAIEGAPPTSVAKITGISGPADGWEDIVIKSTDFTLGDLEVPSTDGTVFDIREERDKSLTINGVISGPGNLMLWRSGGFCDGVQDDELITITGSVPNTITGEIRLYNQNGSGQPSYWVADKVGAFGQTAKLTLEGRSGSGIASLQFTANTMGGEGAIDDDATEFYIGASGILSVDGGVNENIGSGKLLIDLEGTGTFTTVPDGVYDSSAAWVTGDGTITVIPEPCTLALLSTALAFGCWRRRRKQ